MTTHSKKSPATNQFKKSDAKENTGKRMSAKAASPIHNTAGGEFPDVSSKPNKTTKEDSVIAFRKN